MPCNMQKAQSEAYSLYSLQGWEISSDLRFLSLCAISSLATAAVGFGHVTKYVHRPGGGVSKVNGGLPRRMARVPSMMAVAQ